MKTLSVIAGREVRLALRNRSVVISALIFAVWFPAMTAAGIAAGAGGDVTAITGGIAAITLPVGVFMGYIFCADTFLREKRDGTIETLLCAPVSLRRLWEGKAVGITVPAYLTTLLSAVVIAVAASAITGMPIAVDPLLILHLAFVVP
ncbi:MAG: ABC transporter permease subunit, partial [Methanoculleus sp.]|nr:ABC transporter permease subunit [Methanoculleus sp.]